MIEKENTILLKRVSRMKSRRKKMLKTLEDGGFNIRRLNILGMYVHIDTYRKYEDRLGEVMAQAGFICIKADSKTHLDGYKGFRMSFKLGAS